MAGKVKNEVEGEAKVTGEEQLQSFYESIVGILSAMQVADPYAQLFATALTTASNSADAGTLERYTAALKKFNDNLAKTAELVKSGELSKSKSGLTNSSITNWIDRIIPHKGMAQKAYAQFKGSSGKEREKAAEGLVNPVRMMKKFTANSTEKTTEAAEMLADVFSVSESELKKLEAAASKASASAKKTKKSVQSAAKSVEEISDAAEKNAKAAETAAKKTEAAEKKAASAEKKSASKRRKTEKEAEKQPAEEEKPAQRKISKRKAQPQTWSPEAQHEPERQGRKIKASVKKEPEKEPPQGEGLLKKAEKSRRIRRGTTEIRQLSDIENDLYKALSDKKNSTISTNFKALLDEWKKPVHDDGKISSYAALLSKSVNSALSPKTTEKIQSLVNEWNVSNRVNEIRSQAGMAVYTGKETAVRSLMPQLKFIADPYGTDRKAVAQSKIPALEKKISGINYDDSLSPEKRIENIRSAIDKMFQFVTAGVTDLESEVKKAQTGISAKAEAKKEAPSRTEQKDTATEAVTQTAEQVKETAEQVKENDKTRKDIAEKAADSAEKEIKAELPPAEKTENASQALENANINVTNGYFDIGKLASAIDAGKEGSVKQYTPEDMWKYISSNITHVNDATYGNRALTITDKGKFVLGDKDDILAWINDPTNVVQFITDALNKKNGKTSKPLFTAEQIESELLKAKAKSSYEGAELSHIDRHAIEIELKTKGESYDNDKINQIVNERSYAMNTIKDILSSRNVASGDVKSKILSAALNDKGEFDYGRVGILNNMYWPERRSAQNTRGQISNVKQQYREEQSRNRLYDRAVKSGAITEADKEAYKSLLTGDYSLDAVKMIEELRDKVIALEESARKAAEALGKSNTELADETRLIETARKARRNGLTEFTDREGNVKPIDSADVSDIAAIKKALAEKPEKDINSLVSGMDGSYLSNAITAHIDKYISRLPSYDKRFLGRGSTLDELKSKSMSDIYKEGNIAASALAEPLKKKINEILTSGASDKKVINQLTSLKDGGLEKKFEEFFKSLNEKIYEILEKADTEGPKKNADIENGEIDIDKGSPFLSVYQNDQYKLNDSLIQQETERIQQLLASKNGASEEETKKINSEINRSTNVIEALRKQNKALETQAKNLADEAKKGRMTFGKSVGESIKAGLYRWNQNAQNRGGILGGLAKFGANRMEGGALQKLLGVNVGGIIGAAAGMAAKKAGETAVRIAKESLADFGNVQTIQTNLGTVYGSQSAADMTFSDIAKYATKSPFGVQQTSDFAVLLKQSGVYENDLMKTLSMIGDVAGGNQEKYSRIANNYAQIVAANKATAMDMRQFANAGIPIYKAVKEYLARQDSGKYGNLDTAAVRKMTQNGEMTADVIEGVFKMLTGEGGSFHNSVQRGAKTYKAQMQNMQDIRQLAGAAVGETLFSFGQNWSGGFDKESKSIFQKILDFTEKIYNGIEDQFTKWNLERKHETAENDKERRKNIEDAVKFYKDNPDYDVNGAGLEYYEDLLKNYKATFDYAEIRATNSQLFDVYNGKANKAKKLADSNATDLLEVDLKSENSIYEIKDSLDNLAAEGKQNTEEYKKLLNQMDFLSQNMANLGGTVEAGAAGIQSAIDKAKKEEKENREQSQIFLYWKNQTLAERAMSTAYGINAKAESLNKNSTPSLSSWIEEQYKNTDAYKKQQEQERKDKIQKAESTAKWQKNNNVTESNRFGFVINEASMASLARDLLDNFSSDEAKATREYITDENGKVTEDGKEILQNIKELGQALKENSAIESELNKTSVQKSSLNGSEYSVPLGVLINGLTTFANKPNFGTYDEPTTEEKNFYANIAAIYKRLAELDSKTEPLTEREESERTILSKLLTVQSVATVDTSKLKAVEDAQTKEYIPLWKRLANQSLGVPIQMLTNNRSNTGALYDISRTRSQTGQIATAMLQSGSSLGDVADLMAYSGKTNSRINGGATSTRQIDWKKTSDNMRSFALSIGSATEVTSAYVSSIQEQQSQVYSMLTGWKSMEDFDKMTDEKLKDSLGQVRQETKKTITEYASTFGYSGTISDLEKNVIDLTNKIEESGGETRRVYKDQLVQQMSVLLEMLKTQRKTAESVLAIKNSITDLSQQTESSEDEMFMNTVQTVGVQPEGIAPMRTDAQELFWKSLSQSVNSQQSLVQAYDDNRSGKISYKELAEHLQEILDALDDIEKNTKTDTKTDNGMTPVAMKPVEKQPLVAVTSEFTGKGLKGLPQKEQAGGLINAVKGGAAGGELHNLYMQTDFSGLDWGRYAKDNGLSLEQALSVTNSASSDVPFIKKGFESANGSMKIEAQSVTVQAKEADVESEAKAAEDSGNALAGKASEAAAAARILQFSNMYAEAYKSSGAAQYNLDAEKNKDESADGIKIRDNIETDMSLDRRQMAMHAFDVPFVMPFMNSMFGGADGTKFQPYTNSAGEIMKQYGMNTRNQQRGLNFLEEKGLSGAGSMSVQNFVDGSVSSWGSGDSFNEDNFNRDAATLMKAGSYAGVADTEAKLDSIGMSLSKGGEDNIEAAKRAYEELVEEMSQGDFTSYLDGQLKNLSNTMKETFSSSILSGVNNSFVQMGKNLRNGENALKGMSGLWKNIASEMTGAIGASLTQTGLQIAGAAAADHRWGDVAAALAMVASGGICSIASGLLTDSDDSDSSSDDDGREQRIQNLKDALSDLIDQAKTDAEYYEKNLLHKNALSANEAVSTRSVNDAIITPGGNVVTTHPDDYLIATKTPDTLLGGGGTANVTVQVNPVVINQSSANITAQTETRENDDGSVDIITTIVDVMNNALATGKVDEGMAAYEANKNGRSVVS